MPPKGRPRLTPEAYQARLKAYCDRYAVTPSASGLAPFPSGQRETPQHREWLSLYKAHSRLARHHGAQCERCAAPASDGSLFCEAHGGAAPWPDDSPGAVAGRRLLKAQGGRCPICAAAIEPTDASARIHSSRGAPSVLHGRCAQLVELAQGAGPRTLDRVRAYLRPSPRIKSAR
jgi:hypothetical protein